MALYSPQITGSVGSSISINALTGQISWITGLGAINQIAGPSDQALSIVATAPVQAASSVAGNALNITASAAIAGSSNAGAAVGGDINITPGSAARLTSGNANGGNVTINSGSPIGTGTAGSITLSPVGAALAGGDGGSINLTSGYGSGGFNNSAGHGSGSITLSVNNLNSNDHNGGSINLTSGNAWGNNQQAGSVNITAAACFGTSTFTTKTGGNVIVIAGAGSSVGDSTPGLSGGLWSMLSGVGGAGTGTGNGGVGGAGTLTSGAGGAAIGASANGGAGGVLTITGGVGGASSGTTTVVGGSGSAITLTTGAGGNATGASGSRTGGASGILTLATGAAGTGATANGAVGSVVIAPGGTTVGTFSASGLTVIATATVTAGGFTINNGAGSILMGNSSRIYDTSNGKIQLSNSSFTDFSLLMLGGSTASFPALKRNAAGIDIRLADDSGYTTLACSYLTWTGQKQVTSSFNSSSTALTDITQLVANVSSGNTYEFVAKLFVNSDVTGGSKFCIGGTMIPYSIIYQVMYLDNSTKAYTISSTQSGISGSAGQASSAAGFCVIDGTVRVSGSGTLSTCFAQNVGVGTSSVLSGSKFVVNQMM